jgi:hypothetical protein
MNYKKLIAMIIALTVYAFTGSNMMARGGGGSGHGGSGFRGGFNGGGFRGGGFHGNRFHHRHFNDRFFLFGNFWRSILLLPVSILRVLSFQRLFLRLRIRCLQPTTLPGRWGI